MNEQIKKMPHEQPCSPSSESQRLPISSNSEEYIKAIRVAATIDQNVYEGVRKEIAKGLGIRVSLLDQQVKDARKEFTQEESSQFPAVKPWEEPAPRI